MTKLRDPCEIAIQALIAVRRVMARISLQCHVLGDMHPQMMLRLHVDPCPFGKAPSVACTTSSTPLALPLRHVVVLEQAHRCNPARFDQWRSKRPSPRLHGGSQHVAGPTPRRGLVSAALSLRVGLVSVPIMDSFRWFTPVTVSPMLAFLAS